MKKTRNSFFSEASMYNQGFNANPQMPQGVPYQTMGSAYNSFYAGAGPMASTNDIESRLAKIERQINRLDHRISKLEANSNTIIDDYDSNTTNMYML